MGMLNTWVCGLDSNILWKQLKSAQPTGEDINQGGTVETFEAEEYKVSWVNMAMWSALDPEEV